jgi:hypothetical protein
MPAAPQCATCGQGFLQRKRVYRMSGPAVVIGFILLIPSILGICFGGLTMLFTVIGSAAAPSTIDTAIQEVKTRLVSLEVPDDIVADVIAGKHVEENRLTPLTYPQRSAIHESELKISTAKAAPGLAACCGGGFSVMIMIGSFVGGLLGWLLVMRKTVLQCFRCGAVVPAS